MVQEEAGRKGELQNTRKKAQKGTVNPTSQHRKFKACAQSGSGTAQEQVADNTAESRNC
jgi:hypothetical protein